MGFELRAAEVDEQFNQTVVLFSMRAERVIIMEALVHLTHLCMSVFRHPPVPGEQ